MPTLRFPDFEGEWDTLELNEIATRIGDGIHGTPNYDEEGGVYFVNGNNLSNGRIEITESTKKVSGEERKKHDRDISDRTILMSINGTIGNLAYYRNEPVMLGKSAAYINVKPIYNLGFIYNYLSLRKIQAFFFSELTGSTIKNLSLKTIRETKVRIPTSQDEQDKIASFLSSIDERINLLEQKRDALERYKKGVMQKFFSQEIRFKDENGNDFPDWEEKRLEEILVYEQPTKYLVSSTEYKDAYETPVLTAGKTFLLGYTNESKGVFKEKLPTIIFDDFTTAFQWVDFPFKAKSSAMKMLLPKTEDVHLRFVFEAMKTIKFPLAEHKRYWISEFQKEQIPYPSLKEQKMIVEFVSKLDSKSSYIEKQILLTKGYKKGLLQKMFV